MADTATAGASIADPYDVIPTITSVADSLGVDPVLAVADAQQESGLNPSSVGDNDTSFGLYNLHWGGELNQLGPDMASASQAALNPATNAEVALAEFASVAAANPGADPGTIAALAERPADPGAYAAAVNAHYQADAAAGLTATGGTSTSPTDSTGTTLTGITIPNPLHIPGDAASATAKAVVNGIKPIIFEGLFLAGAVGLVALGLYKLASPRVQAAANSPEVKTAVQAAAL